MRRSAFLPFSPPCLGDEEIDEVVATLRSGWLTTGPRARRFEAEFAALVGAPAALALNSCSAGLLAGLAACGVGPGDAVVTTPMTYVATIQAIEQAGARPVFADVSADTLNLDPQSAAAAIGRALGAGLRVRALLPVHYAGHPCDMDTLGDLAAAHGLAIVEDAAHALPSAIGGRSTGAPVRPGVRSAASFSFYANKNLTTGEGGMLTGTAEVVDRARTFAQQGLGGAAGEPAWQREAVGPGFKLNMPDLAAAIGLRQMEKLTAFQARRRMIAARYDAALRDVAGVTRPAVRPGVEPSRHLYVVRLDLDRLRIDRDAVVREMTARNVGTSVHFRPVHLHAWFRDRYGLRPDDCPQALAAWPRVLTLPLHPAMTVDDADDVVAALTDVVRAHRR